MKKLIATAMTLAFTLVSFAAMAANVNKDDAATIAKDLKGVGMKKAELIVQARKDGKFKDAADLVARVKGIGPKTIEKNKDKMSF